MPQMTTKPLSWFKTNPQVRKSFDEEELRLLGESLKAKQLQPVLAQPDGTLIAGERRYRGAGLVGLKELQVIITDEPLTDTQISVGHREGRRLAKQPASFAGRNRPPEAG